MMPPIAIEWTATSYIEKETVRLSAPLIEAAALQAVKTRDRIVKKGQAGGGGRFRPYAKSSRKTRRRLGLQTRFKDFKRTGTFWESMKSKLQSPSKASVVFTGRAAKGKKTTKKGKRVRVTNAALARILNDKESVSIFEPTDIEVAAFGLFVADRIMMDVLTEITMQETAYQTLRRARSAQRKAKQALRATRGRA
tara:strand:- start:1614 stop:2198 length:585 start_codon:yes stop_codon:yes gene_type:complete